MFDLFRNRIQKTGQPPGALIYVGRVKEFAAYAELISYAGNDYSTRSLSCEELRNLDLPRGENHWVRVVGVHDPDLARAAGERFGLHPVVLEDVLNTTQRPKLHEDSQAILVVAKDVMYLDAEDAVQSEQVSLAWTREALVSFQENEETAWDVVRERLRVGRGRLRQEPLGYLMAGLLDALVDGCLDTLGRISIRVEALEDEVLTEHSQEMLFQIYALRREIIFLREFLWPFRDVLGRLIRVMDEDAGGHAALVLKDVHDHAESGVAAAHSLAEVVSGMLQLSISLAGMRMNEVMKVLTLITTIFIPLSFIAGVYGMNFKFMPELEWEHGYFVALAFMAAVGLGMAVWFVRKKWM